jgi:lipoprotein-anchoring transpeptidase ErfK/SrfK
MAYPSAPAPQVYAEPMPAPPPMRAEPPVAPPPQLVQPEPVAPPPTYAGPPPLLLPPPFPFGPPPYPTHPLQRMEPSVAVGAPPAAANAPAVEADQPPASDAPMRANLRRQVVAYQTREAPGTIVIDTANTYLYFVLSGGQAIRYGIGVGREGFDWSGVEKVSRKQEWPDWHPPAEMIERQPNLPRFMAGGPGNPLGARAMYLGNTLYRIHGTAEPNSIGQRVSSGCIRLLNEDVIDLFDRTPVGARVVVLPANGPRASIPGPQAN